MKTIKEFTQEQIDAYKERELTWYNKVDIEFLKAQGVKEFIEGLKDKGKLSAFLEENFYCPKWKHINLTDLKFSKSVDISHMYVKGDLYQSNQRVTKSLDQSSQSVDWNLLQEGQKVGKNYYTGIEKVRGEIFAYGVGVDYSEAFEKEKSVV